MLAFVVGVTAQRSGHLTFLDGWREIAPLEALRSSLALSGTTAEHIGIEIGRTSFLKLSRQRDEALRRGHIDVTNEDAVPARVHFGEEVFEAMVRLKGDYPDHVGGDKWSLRVDLKGSGSVLGMRRFSLMAPHVRRGVHEWLYHEILRHEGLMALRYHFVHVELNGIQKGIYALEEHFDRPLAESSGHREGVFLRLSEEIAWSDWEAVGFSIDDDQIYVDPFFAGHVDAYRSAQVSSDPALREQFQRASRAMDAFRQGRVAAGDVFDPQKMGRFYALSDLLGAQHAVAWYNMRFFWNPVLGRLEPVGFDALAGQQIHDLSYTDAESPDKNGYWFYKIMQSRMFADPRITSAYVAELERITAPGYLEGLFETFSQPLEARLELLRIEDPAAGFSTVEYVTNQAVLRHYLEPPEPRLQAFVEHTASAIELWVGSSHRLPIDVLGVYAGEQQLQPDRPLERLAPKQRALPVDYHRYRLTAPLVEGDRTAGEPPIHVTYRLLGASKHRSVLAQPAGGAALGSLPEPPLEWRPNAEEFSFVRRNASTGWLEITPGRHRVERTLVVPAGTRLVGFPGTELELAPGTVLLSHSPLELKGDAEAPFVVRADADAGLAVVGASESSSLDHVRFEGLTAPVVGDWSLTGAVTFYESPLQMRHCSFKGTRSEDALNVVRTSYTIERTTIEDCPSDALDADASTGTVEDSRFLDCGGDAVDLSLGELTARGLAFEGIGDKAFSIGERSWASIEGCTVEDAGIGVASKDGSYAHIQRSTLRNVAVGLAAYRKKEEYGPARLRADGIQVEARQHEVLLEEGSWILRDEEHVAASSRGEVQTVLTGLRAR